MNDKLLHFSAGFLVSLAGALPICVVVYIIRSFNG